MPQAAPAYGPFRLLALDPLREQSQAVIVPAAFQSNTRAPNFTLNATPDQKVSLSEFRGQPVVMTFYPADWSPVCGDQMALYNEVLPEFRRHQAALLGISVDSAWCHAAFAANRKLHFPLLSDFEPKGEVARSYGAYRSKDGTAERALFVLDDQGVIYWSYLSPVGVNPGADGILQALESLSKRRAVRANSGQCTICCSKIRTPSTSAASRATRSPSPSTSRGSGRS